MNMNETDTSSVSVAFGAVTQAGNPVPTKSIAARRKVIQNPRFPFDKAITPELNPRLCSAEWKKLCGSHLTEKLLHVR